MKMMMKKGNMMTFVLMTCFSVAFPQALQSQNSFMPGLAASAMNNIKSLGNFPNAMTMSQKCNLGMDMSAYPQSGNPMNSFNMGGNALCPCLTFDAVGCPVCKCRQPNTTSKANDTQRVPFHPQKSNVGRLSSTSTIRQLQTSTPKVPMLFSSKTSPKYTPQMNTTRLTQSIASSTKSTEQTSTDLQIFDFTVRGVKTTIPTKTSDKSMSVQTSVKTNFHNETMVMSKYESLPMKNERSFPLAVLFCCLTILTTILSGVFFVLWRKSRKTLNHEKNELYFVEKSVRNSSIVSTLLDLEKNSKRESIYSQVGIYPTVESEFPKTSPELPPRTPSTGLPLTPTAPPVSPNKEQTSFKFPPDDIRHDYLELI